MKRIVMGCGPSRGNEKIGRGLADIFNLFRCLFCSTRLGGKPSKV